MFDLVCGIHCAQSLCAIGSNGPGGEISRNLSVGKASEDIDLSVGAALVALRWWLQVSPPGERLNIITGVGKSRKPWRDADLRTAVADVLRRLESF